MINNLKTIQDQPTLAEFKLATEEHQKRVLTLGQALFENFRSDFSNEKSVLTQKIVTQFLSLHDHSKTSILPDGTNQIEALYQFYGVNKSDLAENERFQILSTINYINYLDSQKALEFFNQSGLISDTGELNQDAHNLLLIERISDMVDRGEHILSTKEFNRKLTPASQILENQKWIHYAEYLEKNYSQIIHAFKIENLN
jgi:hypothetical protein